MIRSHINNINLKELIDKFGKRLFRVADKLQKSVVEVFDALLHLRFKDYKSVLMILNSLMLIWLFLGVSTSATTQTVHFASFIPVVNWYVLQLVQIVVLLAGIYSLLKSYAPGIVFFALFCMINTILLVIETVLFYSIVATDPNNLNLDCNGSINPAGRFTSNNTVGPSSTPPISSNSIASVSVGSFNSTTAPTLEREACVQNAIFTIKLQLSVGLLLSLSNMFLILIYVVKGISNGSFQDDETDADTSMESADLYYVARSLNPWETVAEPLPIYQPKDEAEPPVYEMAMITRGQIDTRLFPFENDTSNGIGEDSITPYEQAISTPTSSANSTFILDDAQFSLLKTSKL